MGDFQDNEMQNTRRSLLIRLQQGGPTREVDWTQFYASYAPIISGFARRIGAGKDERDDLVQDVMHAFFRISPEFRYDPDRGSFRGYLKTCVCNKLAERRRQKHPAIYSADAFPEAAFTGVSGLASEPFTSQTAENLWNDVWETEKLHRALVVVRQRYSTTPDRQRTFRAFEMCTLLDRPTEAVAAELQLTADSVRQAKSRISKALKQAFDELDSVTG